MKITGKLIVLILLLSCSNDEILEFQKLKQETQESSFCMVNINSSSKNFSSGRISLLSNSHISTNCEGCNNSILTVRIKVWVIRKSDGTGGEPIAAVTQMLQILSDDYRDLGIEFENLGINDIDEDEFYYPDDQLPLQNPNVTTITTDALALVYGTEGAQYRGDDRIDIFVLPAISDDGGGVARLMTGNESDRPNGEFPGNALALGGRRDGVHNVLPTSVISHEMGHCLGLYHTDNSNPCEEFVNGDAENRAFCGDFISDTAPTPNVLDRRDLVNEITCEYIGSETDGNGDLYVNPEIDNVMTVSFLECISNKLTTGQVCRQKTFMLTHPVLAPIVSSNVSCGYSNWELTNNPTSMVVSQEIINIEISETGSACLIQANSPSIKVRILKGPVGVTYNDVGYGVFQVGQQIIIPISGTQECIVNPIILAPFKFGILSSGSRSRGQVEIELSGVSTGHTKSSEKFIINIKNAIM